MTETSKNLKKKLFFGVTKANFGGAQKYVFDLASGLKGDFDITVIAGNGGILGEKLEQNGVRTVYFPELDRDMDPCLCKETRVFFKLVSLFQKENPEILHLNSSKMGGLGAAAARFSNFLSVILNKPRTKIIFTAHGWAFNENRPFWQRGLAYFFSWLIVFLSDETIAVSDKTKLDITRFPLIKKKVTVIKNGIRKIELLPRLEAEKKIFSEIPPPDVTRLVTVAELHESKNIRCGIEAVAELISSGENISYTILGEGEKRKFLEKLIGKKNINDSVKLFGYLEEAPKYLSAFDIFILPSITEALGYVILEAGAANLPVAATNVGGIPEIVKDGTNGILVPPNNPTALAVAIKKLMQNAGLRKKYGENLNETVMKNFSVERMVQETGSLYLR